MDTQYLAAMNPTAGAHSVEYIHIYVCVSVVRKGWFLSMCVVGGWASMYISTYNIIPRTVHIHPTQSKPVTLHTHTYTLSHPGSFEVCERAQRHFATFACTMPSKYARACDLYVYIYVIYICVCVCIYTRHRHLGLAFRVWVYMCACVIAPCPPSTSLRSLSLSLCTSLSLHV